jgi:hypothetical protein
MYPNKTAIVTSLDCVVNKHPIILSAGSNLSLSDLILNAFGIYGQYSYNVSVTQSNGKFVRWPMRMRVSSFSMKRRDTYFGSFWVPSKWDSKYYMSADNQFILQTYQGQRPRRAVLAAPKYMSLGNYWGGERHCSYWQTGGEIHLLRCLMTGSLARWTFRRLNVFMNLALSTVKHQSTSAQFFGSQSDSVRLSSLSNSSHRGSQSPPHYSTLRHGMPRFALSFPLLKLTL